jgi:Recombination endonuclease VII
MKTCKTCMEVLEDRYFRHHRRTCRFCVAAEARERRDVLKGLGLTKGYKKNPEKQREWAAANRDKTRGYRLKWRHGITKPEFDALLAEQDGRCAVCKTGQPVGHGFNVDHDHNTGSIRGILCPLCNTGIGKLGDTAEGVRAAYCYLVNQPTDYCI